MISNENTQFIWFFRNNTNKKADTVLFYTVHSSYINVHRETSLGMWLLWYSPCQSVVDRRAVSGKLTRRNILAQHLWAYTLQGKVKVKMLVRCWCWSPINNAKKALRCNVNLWLHLSSLLPKRLFPISHRKSSLTAVSSCAIYVYIPTILSLKEAIHTLPDKHVLFI